MGPRHALPKTITARVVDRLRDEIRDGALPPGTRLRQAHVAEAYGVSTTPVREAFAALEREGLLQSSAHRGVYVFEPSVEDLRELYEVRIPLEALATERAVPNLDEEHFGRLSELLREMATADRRGDFSRSGELNSEFHSLIYSAADRVQLVKLIADLRDSSRAYTSLFPVLVGRLEETEREHEAIYEACLDRAPDRAAQAMTAHLRHTVDVVSRSLEAGGHGTDGAS
ncbi:MAG TPA: GntR family transcriptional regulator [Solirubrobacterales bacterium]|nr:GntR family transcriptional regulator [Solirubrobacterales bacterium]